MPLPLVAFVVMAGTIVGGYAAVTSLPGVMARRRLDRRLRDVSLPTGGDRSRAGSGAGPVPGSADDTVVKHRQEGPMPSVDRRLAGSGLARLIDQSGVPATPSGIVVASAAMACAAAFLVTVVARQPVAPIVAGLFGAMAPAVWLMRRRSVRIKRFEEQFPEALDLLSRAIRAGHAFQTAMRMVAEELPPPVGPEFKKTFDQQNFGLPLRDALNELSERVSILDVRFFVTAVLIQRESGGNLAEILDNLAHVVRERFKIRRQVRVHTAHGRFTSYVLLALPASLAVALSFINPDLMRLLFQERMGQMLLMGAIVLQTIGFFWIRQVIKIEV